MSAIIGAMPIRIEGEALHLTGVPATGGYSFQLAFTTDDGTPLDLTGRTYEAFIRARAEDTGIPVAEFTITVGNPLAGTLTLSLTQADKVPLVGYQWRWDLAESIGAAEAVILYLGSTITVERDVTHP